MATLQPPNAEPLERALSAVGSELLDIPVPLATLWNPWSCPERLLPWLAWAFSVDVWDAAWPLQTKRRVLAEAFAVHKRKGTVGAVKRATATLDLPVELVEWFQRPDALPHTFSLRADISGRGAAKSDLATMVRTVEAVKPARSHLRGITLTSQQTGACAYVSGRSRSVCRLKLLPAQVHTVRSVGPARAALALSLSASITLTSGGPFHDG